MKIIKGLLIFVVIIVVVIIGLVITVVVTDYVPDAIEEHDYIIKTEELLGEEITITTFNIGYCGLDKDQDFFMDGGTGSRSSSIEQTKINLKNNIDTMISLNSDIYLLQEVDVNSTRSYKVNQKDEIEKELSEYSLAFTNNYLAFWVPVPLSLPMGKTDSGLMTLVKGDIESATRYNLPNDQTIPDRYFLLDRCIDEIIIPLENNKILHVINLHLSAYDSAGIIKKEQMKWLREFIIERDLENNYYIFGGDWNQLLSEEIVIDYDEYNPEWLGNPPHEFDDLPVKWVYDISVNTVRDLYEAYNPGGTFETVIDGFLVSSNIEVVEVTTIDKGFVNSDHNPVNMKIRIK